MTTKILQGDVREVLKTLPSDSVDCCITSPPYWGLRSYLADDHADKALEIGLEPTLAEHIAVLVSVFDEVRRVLKPAGTFWLNYGDCYATAPNGRSAAATKALGGDDRTFRDKPFSTIGGALKPKDLCMIPNRLAIALQEAGWWVRSEIIWGKKNPMPDSSGKFRPSSAHEKIFLLAKSDAGGWWVARDTGEVSAVPDLSERVIMPTSGNEGPRWIELGHYYNAEASCLPASEATHARLAQDVANQVGSKRANGGRKTNGNMKAVRKQDEARKIAATASGIRNNTSMDAALAIMPETRYLRTYEPARNELWEMSTQPFSEAHYATFPPELVERCLRAGCPPATCPQCGTGIDSALISKLRARTNGNALPTLRHSVPEAAIAPDQVSLLQPRVCSQREAPPFSALWGVRERDTSGSQEAPAEVLQQDMQQSTCGAKSGGDKGMVDHVEGLQTRPCKGASEGEQVRLRLRTSTNRRASAPEAISSQQRSSAPQERGAIRQSPREPRGNEQAGSRQTRQGEAATGQDRLPELPPNDSFIEPCANCGAGLTMDNIRRSVVLDPFGGAGTVSLVAGRVGIDSILIELNTESIDIASRRIRKDAGLFADVS